MVEMWSNVQSIRFVNEHVRILGRRGKLRTRMCAGGSEICTAAYSFHGLKGGRSEGSFFVPNDTYAVGSSFGAASWMLAIAELYREGSCCWRCFAPKGDCKPHCSHINKLFMK